MVREAFTKKIVKRKVKELVAEKGIKVLNLIKVLKGMKRFDIAKIMGLKVLMPLGQLLNESA